MTQIKNIKVYGLEESIKRSGLPMRTGEPNTQPNKLKDYDRARKLASARAGSGHDTLLKGIIVQFDLKYPQYFTPQLQRYHWVDIISSQSKMHCLTKGEFGYNDYVDEATKGIFESYINIYNNNPTYENFMRCISNCPMGLELWMGITTNYLQLKTIYKQRRNHKLKEDWGAFCDMIEKLPMSELIIGERR